MHPRLPANGELLLLSSRNDAVKHSQCAVPSTQQEELNTFAPDRVRDLRLFAFVLTRVKT